MKREEYEKKISTLLDDLASLESYISELFTFSPLPICFVSPAGVVLEFNPAFERISGYKSHEIVAGDIELIFDKSAIEELIKETLEQEEVSAKEIDLLSKDRREIPVTTFTKVRRDEEGKIVGLFIGIFDLTEIKKTERRLREKIEDLEKFQKIAVGRELKMAGLKKEIEELKEGLEKKGEARI